MINTKLNIGEMDVPEMDFGKKLFLLNYEYDMTIEENTSGSMFMVNDEILKYERDKE